MANIFDTYEYRGHGQWDGPNGEVFKQGTRFYWERKDSVTGVPEGSAGIEDTWEMAVMRAESQEIPDSPLTADGWVW